MVVIRNWLTDTKYPVVKWQWIFSRLLRLFPYSVLTHFTMSNTVSVLWEPGTALPARPLGLTLGFCLVGPMWLIFVVFSVDILFVFDLCLVYNVVHVSGLFILDCPLSFQSSNTSFLSHSPLIYTLLVR